MFGNDLLEFINNLLDIIVWILKGMLVFWWIFRYFFSVMV